MAEAEQFVIIEPDEDTHIHANNNSTDTLDVMLMKNITNTWSIQTQHRLSSDHVPVKLVLNTKIATKQQKMRITNWPKFKNSIENGKHNIESEEDIDNEVTVLNTK